MVIWSLCLHNNVYNVERMIQDFEENGPIIFTYGNNSKYYSHMYRPDPIHIYYKNQRIFEGEIIATQRGGKNFNYDKYYRKRVFDYAKKVKDCRVDVQILIKRTGDMEPLKCKAFTGIICI